MELEKLKHKYHQLAKVMTRYDLPIEAFAALHTFMNYFVEFFEMGQEDLSESMENRENVIASLKRTGSIDEVNELWYRVMSTRIEAYRHDYELFLLFIEYEADIAAHNYFVLTSYLHQAYRIRNPEYPILCLPILEYIMEHLDLLERSGNRQQLRKEIEDILYSLFVDFVELEHMDIIKFIIDHAIRVHNLLELYMWAGTNIKTLEYIIDHISDVDHIDPNETLRRKTPEFRNYLLERGFRINPDEIHTCFFYYTGDRDIKENQHWIEFFIDNGIEPDLIASKIISNILPILKVLEKYQVDFTSLVTEYTAPKLTQERCSS